MKRFLTLSLFLLSAFCFGSAPSSAQTAPPTLRHVSAVTSSVPTSSPNTAPLFLAAVAGVTGVATVGFSPTAPGV
jgi:hypothetical protein